MDPSVTFSPKLMMTLQVEEREYLGKMTEGLHLHNTAACDLW